MRNSSDLDSALVARLGSDPVLLALCPNGVYFDLAPAGCTRFVLVQHAAPPVDIPMQGGGGRAIEDGLYTIDARMVSTAGGDINAAAARIDELLEDQPLLAPGSTEQIPGYAWMYLSRETRFRQIERDAVDPTIFWFRRGGHYRLMMSCE